MMSASFSESLVLDDSEKGVVVRGIKDDRVAAKSGLRAGDEIVAATIHLDHLSKNEVMDILKVLEPYDNNMRVLTKKDLNASAGLGSLGLNSPAEMLNIQKDLSLDASAEAPVLSLDGLRGNLNAAPGLKGDINGPTLNGGLPSLSLNTPSADAGTQFTTPSLGLTGPGVKGDVDGTLKTPNVSVSAPQLEPPSASVNVKKPEMKKGNYKPPKFSMPTFGLPQIKTPKADLDVSADPHLSVNGNLDTPDLDLSGPKFDLKSPDLDVNGPKVDLNGSDVNVGIPNPDLDPPSGKIKWPLKWKGLKGPEADLSAPNVNLSTPKLDGGIDTPDVDINLPKAEIKAPELNAQAPNLDVDAPSGKINWPKWKFPNIHGRKANLSSPDVDLSPPTVDGGIKVNDIDYNLPKADLEGPDVNIQTPSIDAEAPSGKLNWMKKWKKPRMHGPKADLDLDAGLNTPDLNLSSPKLQADINTPNAELNLPKADLKGPNVDVQAPNLDVDAPSGKINWPHLKWKKPKAPKVDAGLNADLSTPDLDLSAPNLEGDISAPDIDLPKANVEAPSGKIKFPTWKFSGPKVNAPDVDLHADAGMKTPDLSVSPELNGPDLDLNVPKADLDVKAPNVDMEAPSGKFKWPTIKKPKWSLQDPKINGPDIDVDCPDANINLPKADVDIDAPDVEGPSGKFKWLKKITHGTLKGPKADIDAGVEVPDVDLKNPEVDLSTPDVNLSTPNIKGGIDSPNLNLKAPDLDAPDGKVKFPTWKLPKLKGPKVKVPEMDADLKAPTVDSSLNLPKVDVGVPNADIKTQDISLSAPKIEGGFNGADLNLAAPSTDLKGPDIDLKTQDVDIDAPSGKLKFPSLNMPSFNFGGLKAKAPDAEIAGPDVSVPSADFKSDLDLPKGDFQVPNLSFSPSEIDGNLSAPKVDAKLPKVDAPDLAFDSNISGPALDVSAPKLEHSIKAPKIESPDVDASADKFKWPHFKFPGFGTKTKSPDVDASTNLDLSPDVKVEAPSVEGQIGTPDLDFNADTNEEDDGMAVPLFRTHRLPRHSLNSIEDFDLFSSSKHDTDEKEYVLSKGIRLPKLTGGSPVATEKVDILERLKMAREKAPSVNASPTDARSSIDLDLGASSLDAGVDSSLVRGGTFKVEKPESVGLSVPEISDENDKLSLSLTNMLGLNVKDSDAD